MGGKKRAQRLGQEFGERIGVGKHAHLARHAARIGAEVLAQPFGLRQHGARVLQQRAAGLRRRHARPAARQQHRAERAFHVADSRAGGSERKMRAFRAMRDAARLDDMAEQAEIDQIEAHGGIPILRV